MKKSLWVVLITALLMLLLAACYYLWQSLEEQKQANVELQELAELDKAEMEDQYRLFDIQYGELQKQIRNDSLLALVDKERERAQELLKELQNFNGKQVMVTTHSALILNFLADETAKESVIFLYKDRRGYTHAVKFFDIPEIAGKLALLGPGEVMSDTNLERLSGQLAIAADAENK